MIEARSDAVKSKLHRNLECQVYESRQIGSSQTRDGKSVNVNILGISELKWTGMGEFNSDDHYIYYCGQESLRRNGVAIMFHGRMQNAVLECSLKNDRMICLFSRQTIQYHSNPSLCPDQ